MSPTAEKGYTAVSTTGTRGSTTGHPTQPSTPGASVGVCWVAVLWPVMQVKQKTKKDESCWCRKKCVFLALSIQWLFMRILNSCRSTAHPWDDQLSGHVVDAWLAQIRSNEGQRTGGAPTAPAAKETSSRYSKPKGKKHPTGQEPRAIIYLVEKLTLHHAAWLQKHRQVLDV
jgi:hypothetical protein